MVVFKSFGILLRYEPTSSSDDLMFEHPSITFTFSVAVSIWLPQVVALYSLLFKEHLIVYLNQGILKDFRKWYFEYIQSGCGINLQ